MPPLAAIALVLAVLAALIGGVAFLNHLRRWPAELTRKTIHIGMGLVCLSFPWLFQETWPVLLLAGFAALALAAVRYLPLLQNSVGPVLGAVGRTSWGEIYFPIAVAAVFALRGGDNLLYLIPVLQLTVSDSLGALVGIRYGAHRFQTDDGHKSVEGSLAVFIAAFLATFVPLQYSTFNLQDSLPISLLLALVLTLMEAISWRGLDNVFLPLTCQAILAKALTLPAVGLWRSVFALLLVVAGIALWRQRTHLSRTASLGVGLVLYASWFLGGWRWLLGPTATLIGYTWLCLRTQGTQSRHHLIPAIFAIATPGLFWLYLANTLHQPAFIYPYGLAYAANFGIIAAAFFLRETTRSLLRGVLYSAVLAFLLHAAPYVIVWQHHSDTFDLTLAAAGLLLLTTAVFVCWQNNIRQCPTDIARWCRQTTLAAVASLLGGFLIIYFQPWILPYS